MNTKRKVSVQIEGRSYALITADDEKYVQGVADDVIAQIKKIVTSTNHLDTRDCAILAALNFCDDRNKALRNKKECISKADKIIRQTNDLNKQCSEYKTRLAALSFKMAAALAAAPSEFSSWLVRSLILLTVFPVFSSNATD